MKRTIFSAIAAAAVALFGVTSGAALAAPVNAPYTFQKTIDGNDCSGVFGQGFKNCKDPNGSPVIAKFNTGNPGSWELNTGVFPGISSSMFTLTGTNGSSGTWSYNGTTGVTISSFVVKAGNAFTWYTMNTPATSFSNIDWNTSTLRNKDLSHITFYDTTTPIPLPAAGWLMIAGIGGLAALRRRKAHA